MALHNQFRTSLLLDGKEKKHKKKEQRLKSSTSGTNNCLGELNPGLHRLTSPLLPVRGRLRILSNDCATSGVYEVHQVFHLKSGTHAQEGHKCCICVFHCATSGVFEASLVSHLKMVRLLRRASCVTIS
eukprot:jgi/Botrbrau1/10384/Bobra.146_2s0022.1